MFWGLFWILVLGTDPLALGTDPDIKDPDIKTAKGLAVSANPVC